ncbi:hypothetical protein KUCAC02_020390, partial [Chaenocephalus aceratus]
AAPHNFATNLMHNLQTCLYEVSGSMLHSAKDASSVFFSLYNQAARRLNSEEVPVGMSQRLDRSVNNGTKKRQPDTLQ